MKKITFRIFVALITFIIGIFVASLFIFYPVKNKCSATLVISDNSHKINENEEYAVYSTILAEKRYCSELLVVNDSTHLGFRIDDTLLNHEDSSFSQDIINDYDAKNEESKKLENKFTVNNKLVLISEKKFIQFFKNEDGWSLFYETYPKANGIISLSDVGFNQERTKALVGVGIGCGWNCGEGTIILLEKINGRWIIKETRNLWVS